jgi:hypothetical protein
MLGIPGYENKKIELLVQDKINSNNIIWAMVRRGV